MSLTHIQLLSVPVSDQDRAKDFYVDALGFELVSDTEMGPGRRWVQVRPKGSQTSLTLVTWFETMPPGSLKGLVIETDDLRGDVDALTARGLPVEGVQEAPWGRFAIVHDPDGNGLILQTTTPDA
ncbi:VOC family protein [Actinomadura sp. DC4]|uniref:VOC family protein n=1 Tax=Actinomadura sp. DC4 TaxID=3055069 RepID=UPI0025AF5769|nr:VOC family protein [Actinomadura sp. DC4]MDN3356977.1 VOC family protein [Actinomadura sp. DC4]